MTMTVWQFRPGMAATAVTSKDRRDIITTICELSKIEHEGRFWWDHTFRCPECYEQHDPEATCVATKDYVLIPCYTCESVIRRPYRGD